MTAAAISATPTTPPTTPPAIAPVFELEEPGLEVPEGARVDVGLEEPVDWALDAVDSGVSERSDECYMV